MLTAANGLHLGLELVHLELQVVQRLHEEVRVHDDSDA